MASRFALVLLMLLSTSAMAAPAAVHTLQPSFELKKWGGLDLWVPGGAVRVAPGARLTRVYVHCDGQTDESNDAAGEIATCHAISKRGLRAPIAPAVDRWLTTTFEIVEGKVDQRSARAYDLLSNVGTSLPEDELFVVEMSHFETQHELRRVGCASRPPGPVCDPGSVRTGRTSRKIVGTELVAYLAGARLAMNVPTSNPHAMSELLAVLGVGWKSDQLPLLYIRSAQAASSHSAVLDGMMLDHAHTRAALGYLAEVIEDDADVRLALRFDHAMLAAAVRDTAVFHTVFAALTAELATRDRNMLPAPIKAALDTGLAEMQKIDAGTLVLVAPFGLDPLVSYRP